MNIYDNLMTRLSNVKEVSLLLIERSDSLIEKFTDRLNSVNAETGRYVVI